MLEQKLVERVRVMGVDEPFEGKKYDPHFEDILCQENRYNLLRGGDRNQRTGADTWKDISAGWEHSFGLRDGR